MLIELKGIVQCYDLGHKYVEVVVFEDQDVKSRRHLVGVDIEVSHGKIITFLSELYGVPPGDIVWPGHIKL